MMNALNFAEKILSPKIHDSAMWLVTQYDKRQHSIEAPQFKCNHVYLLIDVCFQLYYGLRIYIIEKIYIAFYATVS